MAIIYRDSGSVSQGYGTYVGSVEDGFDTEIAAAAILLGLI